MPATQTDELISNVYQFRSLLKYIGERYPKILNEWKLGIGPGTEPNTNDADTNPSFDKQRDDDIP